MASYTGHAFNSNGDSIKVVVPIEEPAPEDLEVRVIDPEYPDFDGWHGTWADFERDNELLGPELLAAMFQEIVVHGETSYGGGAMPVFTIKVDDGRAQAAQEAAKTEGNVYTRRQTRD